jgi:hypothetical protein
VRARAAKDVMMRTKTTALALASTLVAAPAVAMAAEADDPPSPARAALRAPVGGHLTMRAQMRAAGRSNLQDDLAKRAVRIARSVADARDTGFAAKAERRRVRGQDPAELRTRIRVLRRDLRDARAPSASPVLQAIAECESGGNPATDTGNGFYGKYQFTLETWNAVGGSGNPAQASEAEQDRRAASLYESAGASPWPVCGR